MNAMDALSLLEKTDIDPALKQALLSSFLDLKSEHEQLQIRVAQDRLRIDRDQLKIQSLTFELAQLKRLRFGKRNESLTAEQLDFFTESLDEDLGAVSAEIEQSEQAAAVTTRKPRDKAGRQALPDHLPRIEHIHEPENCTCGQCGQGLVKIGEDISEQLDVVPAQFTVHRHIRPQYACRSCETVTADPIPPAIIDGGMATPGLLTWVLIGKYADHLPLYRLEQMAARSGVTLARSTLGSWVGRVGFSLEPLYERLKEQLLSGRVIHADETPIRQLDPGKGKTHKSYLWAYRSNNLDEGPPIVLFDYQSGRGGRFAQDFLAEWRGYLTVDDFSGYKALFKSRESGGLACIEVGCLAHARRRFFELHEANQNPMAAKALKHIAELYQVESMAKGVAIEDRCQIRHDRSIPILNELHVFLTESRVKAPPGGASAKAIDYSLKRWDSLERYAHTGFLPIDNNPIEAAIRPVALGRKNWLFSGSERAGQRAAVIQSLIGTAKLNGIDPSLWMRDTLEYLPLWPNNRIDELLPLTGWAPKERKL